ncbi:MAG TPA: hypothetical protein VIN06_12720 [Devosia sp.]
MEKIAMDAFDRGWTLGFATRVRVIDADLEAAVARAKEGEWPLERQQRLPPWLLLLVIGPMPRPAH